MIRWIFHVWQGSLKTNCHAVELKLTAILRFKRNQAIFFISLGKNWLLTGQYGDVLSSHGKAAYILDNLK